MAIELNRAWILDEDGEAVGETNFVVTIKWLNTVFERLNNTSKFVCKYNDLEDFLEVYEPETDGELMYQEAIKDNALIEDLGIVMY